MKPQPLAIVGMACRFPGADSTAAFWDLLTAGRDTRREVPESRWNAQTFHDPAGARPGSINTRHGCFIDAVEEFDAAPFGLSAAEAEQLDPQQRMLLETAMQALRDAGVRTAPHRRTPMGVFVGLSGSEYGQAQGRNPAGMNAYTLTGSLTSLAANRLSHAFNLSGPSMAIDTACSSSLVALHLARQSMLAGDCDLALVAGVNLLLDPATSVAIARLGATSANGRCAAFDAAADGYVRGEGVGVVVLKRLDAAQQDGDRIWAVLRGTALNHDGQATALTAPNGAAQVNLLREALKQAQLQPRDISYVEAHGTGTLLGDPVEALAIGQALAVDRPSDAPCAIGSVKTNIGHLEAAAGIASVIKVALAAWHRQLPASLHHVRGNPNIPFARLKLRVPTETCPWSPEAPAVYAGISSFGIGGANAHAILASPPATAVEPSPIFVRPFVRCVSGASEEACAQQDAAVKAARAAEPAHAYALLRSCAARTAQHTHRLAQVDGMPAVTGQVPSGANPSCTWVFGGQGSFWRGMGAPLRAEPAFAGAVSNCHQALSACGWPHLEAVLYQSEIASVPHAAQVGLFAFQVALAALWRSWGLRPQWVLGHSAGEVAALHVAGQYSLAHACDLILARARTMEQPACAGSMLAVRSGAAQVEGILQPLQGQFVVAARNGPHGCVLSGPHDVMEEASLLLEDAQVRCRPLAVQEAGHSTVMEQPARILAQALRDKGVVFMAGTVPAVAGSTGALMRGVPTAEFWRDNLRLPVQFQRGVETLLEAGCSAFLELGGHPVLVQDLRDILHARGCAGVAVASLQRGDTDARALTNSLATLYTQGVDIAWEAYYNLPARHRPAPAYPFERRPTWHPVPPPQSAAPRTISAALGCAVPAPHASAAFCAAWSVATHKALDDHRLYGRAVAPAVMLLDLVLQGAQAGLGLQAPMAIEDVAFREGLLFDAAETRDVCLTFVAEGARQRFTIDSRRHDARGAWRRHCTGFINPHSVAKAPEHGADAGDSCAPKAFYAALRERQFFHGPAFRAVRSLRASAQAARGEVVATLNNAEHCLDPGMLEGCLQLQAAVLWRREPQAGLHMPVALDRLVWCRPAQGPVLGSAELSAQGSGSVRVRRPDGSDVCWVEGLRAQPVGADVFAALGEQTAYTGMAPWRMVPHTLTADTQPLAGIVSGDALGMAVARRTDLPWEAQLTAGCTTARRTQHRLVYCVPTGAGGREAALALLRAAAKDGDFPLTLVTRHACPAQGEVCPEQAAVWGLARAARSELPGLSLQLIDLPAIPAAEDYALLRHALAAAEPEVGIRQGQAWTPHWESPTAVQGGPAAAWIQGGQFLITGGLGALGQRLASWLSARGAARVVLVGRTARPVQDPRWEVHCTDLGDPAQVPALGQRLGDSPWQAIWHLAGTLDDALLPELSAARLEAVMQAKAASARAVQQHLARKAERLILFSSMASLAGSPGQGAYAAANASLDGMAWEAQADNSSCTTLSVNLGPFDAGMADRLGAADKARLRAAHLDFMPLEEAMEGILHALQRGVPQAVVARAQWRALPALRNAQPAPHEPTADDLVDTLAALPAHERRDALLAWLHAQVTRVIDQGPEALDPEAPLLRAGVDSLAALTLRQRLQAAVGQRIQVPATLAFDYPTLASLRDFLWEALAPALQPEASLGALSEADLVALLQQEMTGSTP